MLAWLNVGGGSKPAPVPPPVTFEELRELSLAMLDDCGGDAAIRLRLRLQLAREAKDLWVLRGEIYQCVARRHCQSEAAARINGLLPAFEGWVPAPVRVAV